MEPGPGEAARSAGEGATTTADASGGDHALPVIAGASLLGALLLSLFAYNTLRRPKPLLPPPSPIEGQQSGGERAAGGGGGGGEGEVLPTVPGAMPRMSLPPGRLSLPPGVLGQVHDVSRKTAEAPARPDDFVGRLRKALGRSRDVLKGRLDALFGSPVTDPRALDELEEALLRADVGVPTTERLLTSLRDRVSTGTSSPDELRLALRNDMVKILGPRADLVAAPTRPLVILVVGVNGSGKTTTVGKLAARFRKSGKFVVIAAADTFRAAASDQLAIWASRAGAELVSHQPGSDPAAVVFDSLASAKARNADVVLIDTAGRLQTAKPLMDQLSKIRRVVDRAAPGGPHETLLVLDGTAGQNAISQARLFNEATPLTGVVVTKLDGTAKGGVVLAIATELGLPVKLIGIGERVEDLREFDPEQFVDALL